MKLISFGRPILDITIKLQPLQSYISIGGVETNVAINSALLGGESVLFGAVGVDLLWKKLENLAQRINKFHLSLQKVKDTRSGIIVLIQEDNRIYKKFIDYGASECFRITKTIEKKIVKGEIFFTSLFSANTSTLLPQWKRMIQLAKSSSLKIAVSMAGIGTIEENEIISLLKFVKDSANFLFMNQREAKKIDLTMFTSQLAVITSEEGPIIAKFGDRQWSVYPQRIQNVYPPYNIGAGDAFTAAFLVSYLRDGDVEKAMRYAHQIASLKLSIPTSHLIPEILEKEVKL